ncbi:cyclase family protein [Sciscionella marina]|uniref:cyclase family protein n=1 Tax=Sciscionella marina TaxID=508770 RepID=UPI0003821074|nr:cyclase family protein [Sciscionella marina]
MSIIDLTMPIAAGMAAYPGEPGAAFTPFRTVDNDGVAMAHVQLFSQLGTHIDAPAHFLAGARTADRIELDRCVGPAHLIPLGPMAPGSVIGTETLREHAAVLAHAERLVFRTGWSARTGADYYRDWPVFTEEAIAYLASFGPRLIGLDTPSPGDEQTNPALHRRLFTQETALVECLVNVEALPEQFELICLPLPLVGLDGAPVRAIARI